jgi:hypothetical protein
MDFQKEKMVLTKDIVEEARRGRIRGKIENGRKKRTYNKKTGGKEKKA